MTCSNQKKKKPRLWSCLPQSCTTRGREKCKYWRIWLSKQHVIKHQSEFMSGYVGRKVEKKKKFCQTLSKSRHDCVWAKQHMTAGRIWWNVYSQVIISVGHKWRLCCQCTAFVILVVKNKLSNKENPRSFLSFRSKSLDLKVRSCNFTIQAPSCTEQCFQQRDLVHTGLWTGLSNSSFFSFSFFECAICLYAIQNASFNHVGCLL